MYRLKRVKIYPKADFNLITRIHLIIFMICDLPELKGVHRKKLYFEKSDIKGSDVRYTVFNFIS